MVLPLLRFATFVPAGAEIAAFGTSCQSAGVFGDAINRPRINSQVSLRFLGYLIGSSSLTSICTSKSAKESHPSGMLGVEVWAAPRWGPAAVPSCADSGFRHMTRSPLSAGCLQTVSKQFSSPASLLTLMMTAACKCSLIFIPPKMCVKGRLDWEKNRDKAQVMKTLGRLCG